MPDGSNLSSILPDPSQPFYATPEASLVAQPASAQPAQPATAPPQPAPTPALPDPSQPFYASPEASLAAPAQAPAPTPVPTQEQPAQPDPSQPFYASPEASLAASAPTTAAQPPPDQPPQESGFFSGLLSGAGAAIREGGQTLSGQAFTDQPGAQPEPSRGFFNEVGYGLGHSFPVIGAGLGAGALGTMAGGPLGGTAGAALGVGAMSAAQDLAPTYAQARQQGMSHDEAVDYAIKHAAASGVIGAATAPLFELAPFKSFVGKLLFQSLAVQPAAGAAGRVGVPLVTGEPLPTPGELARGYGEDVASGVAFGVGHKAYDIGKRAVIGRPGEAPSPETPSPEPEPVPPVSAEPPAAPVSAPEPTPVSAIPAPEAEPSVSVPPVRAPEPYVSGKPDETPVPPAVPAPVPPEPAVGRASPETPETIPVSPALPPDVPVVSPSSPETPQPVTVPPDDGRSIPAGPEPAAGVGAAGAERLPPGEPGGVRPGDTTSRPGDTQALPPGPPAEAGQAGAPAVPAAEPATAGVAPAPEAPAPTYDASNPHPASIGAQIDQLEQLGRNRTPEQTQQLQDLYQQRTAAEQPSPEYAAQREQLDNVNTQIDTLGAQIRRAETRKNNLITPSKSLVAQRDQLEALYRQRDGIQEDMRASAADENQRISQAVYGPRSEQSARIVPQTVGENIPTTAGPRTAGPEATTSEVQPPGAATVNQTSVPVTPAPVTDPQLTKLTQTRDRLAAQPALGAKDTQRLADLNAQIAARQQTLEAKGQGGPRVGGRKTAFQGPPAVRAEADPIRDYKFNNGTSVYRSVFEQAGKDPDLMVNRPIREQNAVLTDHMRNTFGFKSVEIAPDAKGGVDQKIARDAMLDMTRATQDLMASLGLPYEAASLNGRLKLVLDPEGRRSYYGLYSTAGEIRIAGGANSFGHEWTHAVDHMLSERLTGNPGIMNQLLSRYARAGGLNPRDGVQGAFARVLNTIFYDRAAEAARRIDLQHRAAATDRLGNPTKAAQEAQAQIARLDAAGSKLRIQPSEYRAAAARTGKPDYYGDPAELLARAHEAYLAWRMEGDGADPRGAVMPDAAYIRETNRMMGDLFPQAEDRMNIFKAFDELHQAMRNEDVLGDGRTPQGPSNLGISDPAHYGTTVPKGADPQAVRDGTSVVTQAKNATRALLNATTILDPSRPPPGDRPWWRRMGDYARMVAYSHHGIMETIINRAPEQVQGYLREMMDRVAAAPGEGRVTHENFEEAVRKYARGWTGRFANILKSAGFKNADAMSNEDNDMLRHVLTTGESRYPLDPNDLTRTGPSKPIPDHLIRAGGQLRQLMDEVWRATHDSGIDVGYARSGYYPRLYDALKVTASAASKEKFLTQAHLLHSTMFDQEMGAPGSDPAALLEKWTSLSKGDQSVEPRGGSGDLFTLTGHMNELRANLRRQAEITEALKAGPDPALEAELAQRQDEARQIAEAAHPMLRDHTAGLASSEWLTRLMGGGLHDFDTTGPSGKYLRARVLPPEADQIMREFMRTNPADALPNYFHAAARRIAFAERFGANGEDLTATMNKVRDNLAMNTHDANWFEQQILAVTGQQNTKGMQGLMKFSNFIHAAGSVALMPRAAWSALAEPMNAALATGSLKVGLHTFANQFGQLMRTASAKERTEMAEYLTTVTSAMHDSIMLSRMSADYSDSPALNRFMTQYYRVTGLTQLTNSQRIASTGASHGFLAKLARDYQTGGEAAKDTATRWFRELGLTDQIHGDFAKWMTDFKGDRPTVAQLQKDPMSGAYSLAIRRLVDRSIQDPYKVDRAAMSSVPFAGLAFQLMSFNYQFQRNVLQPAMDRIAHAYHERGLVSAAGATLQGATMAGAMVAAGMLTTAMRQFLFAPEQWQKHEDDGDLGGYLLDLAMQRSGLNGTLDPIIQLGTNLRYDANISSLLEGASINWLAKNAQDVISPFVTANDSPNTNTRYFNAARGAFNLVGVPAAAYVLTTLGGVGGPLGRLAAGAALQYSTSPGMAATAAETVAGPKGAKLPTADTGQLPGLPGLPGMPGEGGAEAKGQGPAQDAEGGGVPWGLADDVAKPAWQVFGEPVTNLAARLPGPVKVLGGLGAAAYGAKSFLDTTEPWRGQPAPPRPGQSAPAQ